jgi:hypothetical protein
VSGECRAKVLRSFAGYPTQSIDSKSGVQYPDVRCLHDIRPLNLAACNNCRDRWKLRLNFDNDIIQEHNQCNSTTIFSLPQPNVEQIG